mmetsp:Transcript_41887/g.135555  ORF Transcript_41887/g.135555 Transcript_41887/m.135555 type:complete len:256 (-) Transcript_41887:2099-2866(-)
MPNLGANRAPLCSFRAISGTVAELPTDQTAVLATVRALARPMPKSAAHHASIFVPALLIHPPRLFRARPLAAPRARRPTRRPLPSHSSDYRRRRRRSRSCQLASLAGARRGRCSVAHEGLHRRGDAKGSQRAPPELVRLRLQNADIGILRIHHRGMPEVRGVSSDLVSPARADADADQREEQRPQVRHGVAAMCQGGEPRRCRSPDLGAHRGAHGPRRLPLEHLGVHDARPRLHCIEGEDGVLSRDAADTELKHQ